METIVDRIDRKNSLQASLQRDRESAWEAARYDREQRDQVTSRLRFGSVVFNGASLLTVLNQPPFLSGVSAAAILSSAAFFLVGVVCAAYSLIVHQTGLIEVAGASRGRALILDRAVSLSESDIDSEEYASLGSAMTEAHELHKSTIQPRVAAIWLQNISTGAWLGGAVTIALLKIAQTATWPF
jgi:hypothetical protein